VVLILFGPGLHYGFDLAIGDGCERHYETSITKSNDITYSNPPFYGIE